MGFEWWLRYGFTGVCVDFTCLREEIAVRVDYDPGMADLQEIRFAFSTVQLEIITLVRERLAQRHGIDTVALCDIEMWGRIVFISEIAKNEKWNGAGMLHVLDEYAERFVDIGALSLEMMMHAEGLRH